MAVTNELELFDGARSVVAELMLALLVRLPLAKGFMMIETFAVALLARLPRLTVTMPLVCEKVPCEVLALTKEAPTGSVSVSTEEVAEDGPLLVIAKL